MSQLVLVSLKLVVLVFGLHCVKYPLGGSFTDGTLHSVVVLSGQGVLPDGRLRDRPHRDPAGSQCSLQVPGVL